MKVLMKLSIVNKGVYAPTALHASAKTILMDFN